LAQSTAIPIANLAEIHSVTVYSVSKRFRKDTNP
jgi:hypothetical protein